MKLRQIESYAAKSCPWHHHMFLCMSSVIKFASWCFSVAGTGSIVFAKNVDGNIQSLQCSFWQFASNFLNTRINELLSVLQNWCLAHNWGGIGTGETWSAKLDHLQLIDSLLLLNACYDHAFNNMCVHAQSHHCLWQTLHVPASFAIILSTKSILQRDLQVKDMCYANKLLQAKLLHSSLFSIDLLSW